MKNDAFLFKTKKPETSLLFGYVSYSLIGLILLSLPLFRTKAIPIIDNLFTTISAISTTGLTTVSISDSYSFLGQIVILILIQLGGIGYMTFGSFIILSSSINLSNHREEIHKSAFSLPKDFNMKKFIRSIVIYTLFIEFVGTLLLLPAFWHDLRVNELWSAVFHSVSAFCTAGFSLYNNSFESYAKNGYLNVIIFILSFLGAIGYIVMVDVWLLIKGKKTKITFTSKIILFTTCSLLFLGGFLLFLESYFHYGYQSESVIYSIFQSMTALTTVGFNTIPIAELSSFSLFILLILMIIGASPSGTGGGIKSTTISSILGIISSVFSYNKEYINYQLPSPDNSNNLLESEKPLSLRLIDSMKIFNLKASKSRNINKKTTNNRSVDLEKTLGDIFKIKLMNNIVPFDRIIHAMATFSFYFIILFAGTLALLSTEPFHLEKIFFEAASALGTVGLSTGITPSLSLFGKIIIIILMFIGRLGPISFGVFLFSRKKKKVIGNTYEDIVI